MQFEETVEILKKNGICGAGGAGFPSYAKLNKKADTIILNCAECEPLFRQHRLLLEKYAYEILKMLEELRISLEAERFIVAVKASYKNAVEAVLEGLKEYKSGKIGYLKDVYPEGDEVVTIFETTGRVVPPGGLPIDVGAVVFNVETVYNMYRAVFLGEPVTHKYITVAGEVKAPKAFKVPLGMSFSEAVALCGGETCDDAVYISGGPMTGRIAAKTECVLKTTNGILVMPKNHYIVQKRIQKPSISIKRAMSSCCQCRTCTDLCSRNMLGHPINPHSFMAVAACKQGFDSKAVLDAQYCSGCGICEMYACPQGLNPRSLIAACKAELKKNGIKVEKKPEWDDINKYREQRLVPEARLVARLDLEKYDKKLELFEDEVLPSKRMIKLSLSQNIGAPAEPIVSVGAKVKKGELLATEKQGALSLPVHCPVCGTVDKISESAITVMI